MSATVQSAQPDCSCTERHCVQQCPLVARHPRAMLTPGTIIDADDADAVVTTPAELDLVHEIVYGPSPREMRWMRRLERVCWTVGVALFVWLMWTALTLPEIR